VKIAFRKRDYAEPMKSDLGWQYFGFFIICILTSVLALHFWASPDIWTHLNRGASIVGHFSLQPDLNIILKHPEAAFYWLYQVICYGLFAIGGVPLMSVAFACVIFAACFLMFRAAKVAEVCCPNLLLMTVSLVLLNIRFMYRPELLSMFFVSFFLWMFFVRNRDKPFTTTNIVLMCLVQALWVNVHGYFVLGPALIGIRAVSHMMQGARSKYQRRLLVVQDFQAVLLVFLASFVSPFGYMPWLGAIQHLFLLSELKESIGEFISPTGILFLESVPVFWLFWVHWLCVGICVVFSLLRNWRKETFAVALSVFGMILAFRSNRMVSLHVMLSAPLLFHMTALFIRWLRCQKIYWTGFFPRAMTATFILAVVLGFGSGWYQAFSGVGTNFGIGQNYLRHAPLLVEHMKQRSTPGKVLADDIIASYMAFRLPNFDFYSDSQYTNAEDANRYFDSLNTLEGFESLNSAEDFSFVILNQNRYSVLAKHLYLSDEWNAEYVDLARVMFRKSADTNATTTLPQFEFGSYYGLSDDLVDRYIAFWWSDFVCSARLPGYLDVLLKQVYFDRPVPERVTAQISKCHFETAQKASSVN